MDRSVKKKISRSNRRHRRHKRSILIARAINDVSQCKVIYFVKLLLHLIEFQ